MLLHQNLLLPPQLLGDFRVVVQGRDEPGEGGGRCVVAGEEEAQEYLLYGAVIHEPVWEVGAVKIGWSWCHVIWLSGEVLLSLLRYKARRRGHGYVCAQRRFACLA
jgi:hypothetical protein